MVTEAIEKNGAAIGAMIIGVADRTVRGCIALVLCNTFAIGSLPVPLALLLVLGLAGSLTRNIYYLIDVSENISRGNFDNRARLESGDGLDDLDGSLCKIGRNLLHFRACMMPKVDVPETAARSAGATKPSHMSIKKVLVSSSAKPAAFAATATN